MLFFSVPLGTIRNLQREGMTSTTMQLAWDAVSCAERGGVLVFYEIRVSQVDDGNIAINRTTERSYIVNV